MSLIPMVRLSVSTFFFLSFLPIALSSTPQIYELTLVDANTGQNITSSSGGGFEKLVIDLSDFPPNSNFSLRADVKDGAVSYVNFTLYTDTSFDLASNLLSTPTSTKTFTDILPPFALAGETPSGQYSPVQALATPGKYALKVATSNNASRLFFQDIEVLARDRVANYTLVNTPKGTDIAPIFEDMSLVDYINSLNGVFAPFEIDTLLFPPDAAVSIRGNTVGHVGSVEFQLFQYNMTSSKNVTLFTSLSNKAPFTLGGVTRRGKYNSVPFLQAAGSYNLQVTAYRGRSKRGGLASPQQLINFVVLPRFRVTNFTLVNVNTETDAYFVGYIADNIISLCQYPPQTTFDIRANLGAPAGSVEFELSYQNGTSILTHVDNQAPFSLGQPATGHSYGGVPALKVVKSRYLLKATPYSNPDKKGTQGMPLEFKFFVSCLI